MAHKTAPISRARGDRTFLPAGEAAAALGVQRRTLYTYASRGLLRRGAGGYLAEDIRRLAARADAHRGHTAAAAGALRWGPPVLDSAITDVSGGRLSYRGRDAIALARSAAFEDVADLLLGGSDGPWPRPRTVRGAAFRLEALLRALSDLTAMPGTDAHDRASARVLVTACSAALGARGAGPMATRVGRTLGMERAIVDRVLVVVADHELNASTFAARVATSAGASLGGALAAALWTFTGRRHGAACTRVEALFEATPRARASRAIRARLARGESIAGFGHPLYPDGDPRSAPLFEAAASAVRDRRALEHALAIARAVAEGSGVRPSVDFALVTLCGALGLPNGTAIALFALGRTAGWLAHALEQREAGELLRPRARYVGPLGP